MPAGLPRQRTGPTARIHFASALTSALLAPPPLGCAERSPSPPLRGTEVLRFAIARRPAPESDTVVLQTGGCRFCRFWVFKRRKSENLTPEWLKTGGGVRFVSFGGRVEAERTVQRACGKPLRGLEQSESYCSRNVCLSGRRRNCSRAYGALNASRSLRYRRACVASPQP